MSTFGSGTYFTSIYGGALVTQVENPSVLDIDVVAADTLCIAFTESMRNNTALQTPSSYAVVAVSSGAVDLTVKSVRAGQNTYANVVYLVVDPIAAGAFYDVQVVGSGIRSVDNQTMVSPTSQVVKARRTKVDSLLSTRPRFYSTDPKSILRNILNAIGREDDRIGGNQNEGEDIVR